MAGTGQVAVTRAQQAGSIRLEVEDVGVFEISQLAMSYGANEHPRATCMVAAGTNTRTGKPAAIHEAIAKLNTTRKAKVFVGLQGEWAPGGADWGKEQTVFEGYVVGLGWQQSRQELQPVLQLGHWSMDLARSSTLSPEQHVSNPGSFVAPSVRQMMGAGTGVAAGVFVPSASGSESVANLVPDDVWAALKLIYCNLSGGRLFQLSCNPTNTAIDNNLVNDAALNALRRIEGPGGQCALPYKYGKPLKMDLLGITAAADRVSQSLVHMTLQAQANRDIWSNLLASHCRELSLVFIPLVETAVIAADTPAFRDVYKTITANEFNFLDANGARIFPLRGALVHGRPSSHTGAGNITDTAYAAMCIGGEHINPEPEAKTGTLLIRPAPLWLDNIQLGGHYAGDSSGGSGNKPVSTAMSPGVSQAPQTETPAAFSGPLRQLYDRYAQMIYYDTILRGRSLTIGGKLRFDIAPGSIVRVVPQTPASLKIAGDQLALSQVGQVYRVTISLNTTTGQAGTTFQLQHVRSDAENQLDSYSTAEHPLYGKDVFIGAPLVPAWAF